MKRLFILAFLVFSSCYASADVTVVINQQSVHFDNNPRLADVLKSFAYQQHWYWPASSLYRMKSAGVEKKRGDIVAKLRFMQVSANDKEATRIAALMQQINSWTLAERVMINIDYDLAQLYPEHNPRFEDGHYRLDLHTRPNHITTFGLIETPKQMALTHDHCIDNYVNQNGFELGNKDTIYIIQPNSQTHKIGIAYWNNQCVDIMPGSQLYFPLAESQFFNQNTDLNKQIIDLAKNRIYL